MNSLKKVEGVPFLNFEGSPGVLLLDFERDPGVPLLNLEGSRVLFLNLEGGPGSQGPEVPGPGILVPLLHHAVFDSQKFQYLQILIKLKLKSTKLEEIGRKGRTPQEFAD